MNQPRRLHGPDGPPRGVENDLSIGPLTLMLA
jgi:hypothetical protein